jgi:SagB-type dehydrogenase family enzyme
MAADKKKTMKIEEFVEEELPLLTGMVTFNTYLPISPYAESTAVNSPEVYLRGVLFSRNRMKGEEYLLNWRTPEESIANELGVSTYLEPNVILSMAHRDLREPSGEEIISLPSPKRSIRAPLSGTILSRRSIRDYSDDPTKLADLSTLLFYGNGVTGELPIVGIPVKSETLGEHHAVQLRTAPSGGGLYPVDIYVLATNVEKLESGVYMYSPLNHTLRRTKSAPAEEMCATAFPREIDMSKAGAMIVFVYNYYFNARKYGDAALAYAFIEVGEISENIHLVSTALGIGSCDIGAYHKHRLEKIMDIDGLYSHVIHLIVIGTRR